MFELVAEPKRGIPTEFGLFFKNSGHLVLKREITLHFGHELEYNAFRISGSNVKLLHLERNSGELVPECAVISHLVREFDQSVCPKKVSSFLGLMSHIYIYICIYVYAYASASASASAYTYTDHIHTHIHVHKLGI